MLLLAFLALVAVAVAIWVEEGSSVGTWVSFNGRSGGRWGD